MTRLRTYGRLLPGLVAAILTAGCATAPVGPPGDPRARTACRGDLGLYWGLERIGAADAWTLATGHGARVAVIDTGIALSPAHPDLGHATIASNANVCLGENAGQPVDRNGHGTQVAGVIAGARNGTHATGVACDASFIPFKITCPAGFDLKRALQAIDAALQQTVDVINASWPALPESPELLKRLTTGPGASTLFVFAAPMQGKTPAAYYGLPNVIVVTASGRGSGNSEGGVTGMPADPATIHLAAPGAEIKTADLPAEGSGTVSFQGPSAAAAFVSGCAALVKSRHPAVSAARLKQLLLTTADQPLPGLAGVVENARRLNCARAVASGP